MPFLRTVAAVVCAVAVLAPVACSRESDVDAQFAQLMQRPDIDAATARYQQMYAEVRQQLTDTFPFLRWQQTRVPDRSACGHEFGAIDVGSRDDAEERSLANWTAEGNLPDAQWDQSVQLVRAIVQRYGFDGGGIVVNRPSDHEVDFYDQYRAFLIFGTAVNTTLEARTGCHLTSEAKRRGYPAPLAHP